MYFSKKLGFTNSSRGFTLVELLVVISIIGTLATLVLLQLGTARAKARDAKRIADVSSLRTAIELYYDDNAVKYPDIGDLTNAVAGPLLGVYFTSPVLPNDPAVGTAYKYNRDPLVTPVRYQVWIQLEARNASALNGDADLNSLVPGWNPANISLVDGANEACVPGQFQAGAGIDCVYDLGTK